MRTEIEKTKANEPADDNKKPRPNRKTDTFFLKKKLKTDRIFLFFFFPLPFFSFSFF